MTHLVNKAEDFADQALDGLVAAHSRYLRKIHGGVGGPRKPNRVRSPW